MPLLSKVILLLADVLAIVCLARMLLQWGQLHYKQPLAEFCRSSTDWLIMTMPASTMRAMAEHASSVNSRGWLACSAT